MAARVVALPLSGLATAIAQEHNVAGLIAVDSPGSNGLSCKSRRSTHSFIGKFFLFLF